MTAAEWRVRAEAVSDTELGEFRQKICVAPAHIGTCDIGKCSRCGGGTSSGTMYLCERCARELGVCPYDGRMVGRSAAGTPEDETLATCWLALLMRGYAAEKDAAKHAVRSFPFAGLDEAAVEVEHGEVPPHRSPATAEFIVGFRGGVPAGLTEGAEFLNGKVVSLTPVLSFVVVRTPDAARFEEAAAADPRVRYVELNVSGTHPPWD